jgi:hypothetical protein
VCDLETDFLRSCLAIVAKYVSTNAASDSSENLTRVSYAPIPSPLTWHGKEGWKTKDDTNVDE